MLPLLYVSFVVVVLAVAVGLYQKNTNAMCKSRKRLDGKTALVTGGTAGMGLRIATDLADRGAKVIVACPFPAEGAAAVKSIHDKTGSEIVIYKYLDLASLQSVRKFAAELALNEERLDILVNNAGVGTVADFLTKDGLNFIMQVNYFGHFLLTLLLLPLLLRSGAAGTPARVVNTTSLLRYIGNINLDHMNRTNYWFKVQIYANSKLALLVFTRALADRLSGAHVVVNAVDPGAVATDIFDCIGSFKGMFVKFLIRNLYKTPWEGAQTALHVALDKKAGEVSGKLFKNCKLTGGGGARGERLWEQSAQLVNLTAEELRQCFVERPRAAADHSLVTTQ